MLVGGRRGALGAVLLAAALGVAVLGARPAQAGWLKDAVWSSMTPDGPFDAAQTPVAPDYADPAAWSALPDRPDSADVIPAGGPAAGARAPDGAPVDVFYVHPTSYVGGAWNGPVDDAALNEATDAVATGVQAPVFNAFGRIWAPRYRQANGTAFMAPSADGERAIALAYGDVERAFGVFLGQRGAERPFVLAGHSQGAVLAERLLVRRIAGTPLQERLVVAVLPGGSATVQGLAAHGLRACATPTETGCVLAWNARGPGYVRTAFEVAADGERVCTNPLTGRADAIHAPASANRGAVFLEARDTAPRPAFADAQCVDGTLLVRTLGRAPRSLASRILDAVVGPENYHPMEYQLFFMNLREDVAGRVGALLATSAANVGGGAR